MYGEREREREEQDQEQQLVLGDTFGILYVNTCACKNLRASSRISHLRKKDGRAQG